MTSKAPSLPAGKAWPFSSLGTVIRKTAAAAILAFGASLTGAASAQSLEALIAAAQAEGEVNWYTGATENVAQQVAEAFTAEYGIPVRILRLSSNAIMQRFSTEAEAGAIVADLIIAGGSAQEFAARGIERGWVQPIADAGLPVIEDGTFPAEFNRGTTALAQFQPWVIVYNTNLMSEAEAPTEWSQLFEERFRGQILLPNPGVSDAYTQFWYLLRSTYGDDFLTRLSAMEPRRYDAACLAPLTKGPFYAVALYPGDLGTKGGLVTDEHGRVLHQDGHVIAGVYAAGNASASVMGRRYPGPGVTLGPAITFAWLAMRDAAHGRADTSGAARERALGTGEAR